MKNEFNPIANKTRKIPIKNRIKEQHISAIHAFQ